MNYLKERKKRKITQLDVALKVGISLVTYQLIERGITKKANPKTIEKIEKLLSSEV